MINLEWTDNSDDNEGIPFYLSQAVKLENGLIISASVIYEKDLEDIPAQKSLFGASVTLRTNQDLPHLNTLWLGSGRRMCLTLELAKTDAEYELNNIIKLLKLKVASD